MKNLVKATLDAFVSLFFLSYVRAAVAPFPKLKRSFVLIASPPSHKRLPQVIITIFCGKNKWLAQGRACRGFV